MSYTEQLNRIGQKPPKDISDMISEHEQITHVLEETKRELEETDKDDSDYKELAELVDNLEIGLHEYHETIEDKIKAWEKDLKKPTTPPPSIPPSSSEKKSGGVGWLLFGGVVLVLTFGAVNAFKK